MAAVIFAEAAAGNFYMYLNFLREYNFFKSEFFYLHKVTFYINANSVIKRYLA